MTAVKEAHWSMAKPPGSPIATGALLTQTASPPEGNSAILPPSHWTSLPQENEGSDDADSDAASLYGACSIYTSSTSSLTTVIQNYRTLNGRRFHGEVGNAQYWGANDEKANESADILHHVITLAFEGELFMAPLEADKVRKVLDIGTSTGTWAMDFAEDFPNAQVIGTDISPIQPGWTPPNISFEIEDCTQEWTFDADTFDYIHMRWLIGAIPDWDELFRQAYKACRPGGWVESYEPSDVIESDDGTVKPDSAQGQWGEIFKEGALITGRPFDVYRAQLQRKAMEAAGFIDIQETERKIPIGGWSEDEKLKEVGLYCQAALEADTEGYLVFIADILGWSQTEVQIYLGHFRRERRSNEYHGYYMSRAVWGRKPEA